MVKMMNAGILVLFIQEEQIVSHNNVFSLERLRSYFSSYTNKPHGFSMCCCTWIQGGFQMSYLLWDNSMAL